MGRMKIIRIIKIILAVGFLAVAYAFITDSDFFGVPAEVFLLIISVLAFLVLFIDSRNRTK